MMEPAKGLYRFDDFELDVQSLRFTASGENCPLEPKSFRLLQFLIENPGRTVSKEEIVAAVWTGIFVSDNSVTRAVTQIRKALHDDAKEPRYIATVPTVGYRFIGEFKKERNPPAVADTFAAPIRRRRWRTRPSHNRQARHSPDFVSINEEQAVSCGVSHRIVHGITKQRAVVLRNFL
jgi:DNA-binding winged helix-turn-helix (wHTH) protein